MTSLEFWKITKEYKLPIQKATKGNIMEWVRLEPILMEDITTLIFAQKTITRSNFFVLEKKWFFDKLQKHKQKFEENLKKENDKIINDSFETKEELLETKFFYLKQERFLKSLEFLNDNEEGKNQNKGETDIILSILKDTTKERISIKVSNYIINEETIAFEVIDANKFSFGAESEEILKWGILTKNPNKFELKIEIKLTETFERIYETFLKVNLEKIEKNLGALINSPFEENELIEKELNKIQKAFRFLKEKKLKTRAIFDSIMSDFESYFYGSKEGTYSLKEGDLLKIFSKVELRQITDKQIATRINKKIISEINFYTRTTYKNKSLKTMTKNYLDLISTMDREN